MSFDPSRITYIGETDYRNKKVQFGIKAKDRTRHMYVIGKTGTGKSTLLENMAVQDIQNGEGFAFIDPHGKTADLLLDYIPENRINDVLYFAPFDLANPVSFNVMEDVGPDKRHLVAAGLMSAFKKIWVDAWSARMEYILNNTILALLEYPDSTLLGINRMLSDKVYRKDVVAHITDPGVKSFWEGEFANYTDRFAQEATPAIQNKVGQFTANPVVRNIIGQPKSTFNIREMMDQKKIILINLSKGQVGEDSANLLGSMLITKIYLAAMSRADLREPELNKLPNFYLYVDEFQSFANESFANILSEARKYKLNLTMAHQYIEQMSDEVRAAVFGNVGTMITFRVGATDAEYLEKEYAPAFTAEDLVNIGKYQAYLKLMIDDMTSAPFSARTLPPIAVPQVSYRDVAIARSRAQFAHPRALVETEILKWHQKDFGKKPPTEHSIESVGKPSEASSGSPKDVQRALQRTERPADTRRFDAPRPSAPHVQPHPAPVVDRETQLRNAVSLSQLQHPSGPHKNRHKNKNTHKGPSQGNLSDLRAALSAVIGDIQPAPQTPQEQTPQVREEKKQDERQPQSSQPQQSQQPRPQAQPQEKQKNKEVPEHVLKDLFKSGNKEA
jgi:hypothetical protein